ncbi:MAG: phytanoyl-CoA dioxygenase family protein [Planctomycetes bacterium]|jgi:hypothetical protein|nr:phytanoyl-CoA dioxygenase family protein [Planctomycetota bacterium]
MLDHELYAFATQGYVHRRGALSPARVAMLLERLLEAESVPADQLPPECARSRTPVLDEMRIRNLPEIDPVFVEAVDDPAWIDIVDSVVPGPCRVTDAYSITRRRGMGLPLHAIELAGFHHRNGRPITNHLTVMVCLSNCDIEDGPFVVMGGSHRAEQPFPYSSIHADWAVPAEQAAAASAALAWVEKPLPRVRWSEVPGFKALTFAAGDVIAFTEDLWHGALAVHSEKVRRTLYYSYSPYHFASWHGLSRSPNLLARCSGRRRELLDGPFVGNSFASAPGIAVPEGLGVPHLDDDAAEWTTSLLTQIGARLAASSLSLPGAGGLLLDIDGRLIFIDLYTRRVRPGAESDLVATRLRLGARVMRGILAGRADPVASFYQGEVSVRGDVALAMQFAAHLLPEAIKRS